MENRSKERITEELDEMRDKANEIVGGAADEIRERTEEWKEKARAASAAAWEATRAAYQQVHDHTVEQAVAADRKIRENPYAALGVAFGAGLLLGFLATHSKARRGKSDEEDCC